LIYWQIKLLKDLLRVCISVRFIGFSVEFAEHRLYNKGESTRDLDWKLYVKTKKLFVKRYEEETNLLCHIIIDNSSSMHYPIVKNLSIESLSKIAFSTVASAALMEILKRQRDAVGLSIYSDGNWLLCTGKRER